MSFKGDDIASKGNLSFMKSHPLLKYTTVAINQAITKNHIFVAKWLLENNKVQCNSETVSLAASKGNLILITLLNNLPNNNIIFNKSIIDIAAANGHLNIIKWLHKNRDEGCTSWAMDWASKYNFPTIVTWLIKNNKPYTKISVDYLSYHNKLPLIKKLYLCKHLCLGDWCTVNAINGAAECGHINCIKWFFINDKTGYSHIAMNNAIATNRLDIVKLLFKFKKLQKSPGIFCNDSALDYAVKNKYMGLLKWLHTNVR